MTFLLSLIAKLRVFLLVMIAFCSVSAAAQDAPEQTSDAPVVAAPSDEAPQENAPEADDLTVAPQPANDAVPVIDLDDPAIVDALEQKEAADKALRDALNAQIQARNELRGDGAQADSDEEKASLIPTSGAEVKALLQSILDKIIGWLTSPSFLAQLGAIALAFFLSPLLAAMLKKRVFLFRDAPAEDAKFKLARDYIYRSGEFLRTAVMVLLLALSAAVLKAVPSLGLDWLVKLAQGLAVVFLLFRAIKTFVPNELFQKLAIWTLIPLAVLMVFGLFDNLIAKLKSIELLQMGDKPITAFTIVLLVIFGALFFRLGGIANSRGQNAIRSQEGLDASTQEVAAKLFQMILFAIVFIMVLSAAKVPLSGLVMIFSALSLGVGLGLQPIAANFVSGLIILFDRSVKVGDYVVLPDGQEGFVEAINMRSTTVETTDGKDIMVPNTQFTEDAYENWTHKDPSQRYEVEFSVAYDTDLDGLEAILMPEILKYSELLTEPEMPDLEFRNFGDNGIKMAIEFWADGIDDGPNKFTSDVGFIIWRTLKANKIEMPLPQRIVHSVK